MNAVTFADLQRLVAARRRLLAAVLVFLAVLSALSVLRPPPPRSVVVLAAARDLAPGAALVLDDLRSVPLPASLVPAGALRPGAAVLGRVVAGPVRRGEPLTDVRLVGPSLLAASGLAGAVAVPVRFGDAGAVSLLRPGDRIDVLAVPVERHGPTPPTPALPAQPAQPAQPAPPTPSAPPHEEAARVVAPGVVVLAVTAPEGVAAADGALVVVACSPAVARTLAAAATTERLSPALLAPGPAPPSSTPPRSPP